MSLTPSSTSTSNQLYSIPKLSADGSNWVLYKQRLESAITAKGLRRHLIGTAKEPNPPKKDATTDDLEKHEDAIELYLQAREAANSMIFSTIPERLQIKVIALKSTKEIWETIQQEFEDQSEIVQIDILHRMIMTRGSDDKDPRETLDTLLQLNAEYAAAGGVLENKLFAAIIIHALPDKFRPLIHAVISAARVTGKSISAEQLIQNISEAAKHDAAQAQIKKEEDAALAARAGRQKMSGNSSQDRNKDVTCSNCSAPGHRIEDCWSKGGGKEGQGPR